MSMELEYRVKRLLTAFPLAVQTWMGRRSLAKLGVTERLARHRRHGFPPEYHDLWYLYRAVRVLQPSCVLEFGSGCSTAVLTQALVQNGGGMLWSIETDPGWAAVTESYMDPEWRRYFQIIQSPVVAVDYRGTPAWRHARVPDVAPDLVYLDGPPLTRARAVAVDILDIQDRLAPMATIIIDGRKTNAHFLNRNITRRHSFAWHRVAYRGVIRIR